MHARALTTELLAVQGPWSGDREDEDLPNSSEEVQVPLLAVSIEDASGACIDGTVEFSGWSSRFQPLSFAVDGVSGGAAPLPPPPLADNARG